MIALIFATAMSAAECAALQPGATVAGEAHVIDGDSLSIEGCSVRLFGIDAPEMTGDGRFARSALDEVAHRRAVSCVVRDHHGKGERIRLVAVCGTDAVPDLALYMVAQGWATVYRKYVVGTDVQSAYDDAEAQARGAGLGVWKQ